MARTSTNHNRIVHDCFSIAKGARASDETKKEKDLRSVCSLWRTVEPNRIYYATVVGDMNATPLVDYMTIFESSVHVPLTHIRYFKPSPGAFLFELKSKDRWLAKE